MPACAVNIWPHVGNPIMDPTRRNVLNDINFQILLLALESFYRHSCNLFGCCSFLAHTDLLGTKMKLQLQKCQRDLRRQKMIQRSQRENLMTNDHRPQPTLPDYPGPGCRSLAPRRILCNADTPSKFCPSVLFSDLVIARSPVVYDCWSGSCSMSMSLVNL